MFSPPSPFAFFLSFFLSNQNPHFFALHIPPFAHLANLAAQLSRKERFNPQTCQTSTPPDATRSPARCLSRSGRSSQNLSRRSIIPPGKDSRLLQDYSKPFGSLLGFRDILCWHGRGEKKRYSDNEFEYRHVQLPKNMLKKIPQEYFDTSKGTLKLLWEEEWRSLGITQVLYTGLLYPTPCVFLVLTKFPRAWVGSITKFTNRNHTSSFLSTISNGWHGVDIKHC